MIDPAKPLGPLGHFTRAKVDWLPVHAESDSWVRTLTELGRGGADGKFGLGQLNCYAGQQVIGWTAPGYPVNVLKNPPSLLGYDWSTYGYFADPGPYPDWQQMLTQQDWDNYCLAVGPDGTTWELIGVDRGFWGWVSSWFGKRRAAGGVVWDPAYTPRLVGGLPVGAGAAAMPISPMVLRKAELETGHVDHPLYLGRGGRVRGGDPRKGDGYIWPARGHDASTTTVDLTAPPYGSWYRLRADFQLPPLVPPAGLTSQQIQTLVAAHQQAQIVVDTLKKHGMIHGDGSSRPTHGLAAESTISQATFDALHKVPLSAFEAVDASSLRKNATAKVSDADYWLTTQAV